MKSMHWKLALLTAAALVAGCGGGSGDQTSVRAGIASVKVMGDSLADSGTFKGIPGYGRIFSVQGSSSEPNAIWTERLSALFGAPQLCNFFKYTGIAATPFSTTAGCTSYAVGGGRINNIDPLTGGAASPFSVVYQLQIASAAGNYKSSDLLLIDGGGNDAADLVGAYLAAAKDGGASYASMAGSLIPTATLTPLLAGGATGLAQIGGVYMVALADKFYASIKASALDKGAEHVAILNMPGITNTPRFQMVLDSISAAYGGGTTGAGARAQSEALFKSWVEAFNTELAIKVAGDKRVVLVDFYTAFNDQVANPAQYGLTNVKTPACPITGLGTDGLPSYNFQTCTAAALTAQTPPTGATGGSSWWQTYGFADGFHPTPYGYQLLSQLVAKSLATAGWL
ncbi:MAG: SGNH/GDSL hydrolase family protein [Burkholderiales bacterium]|nr:SGNH/GDSL hydrolase family protein [Burkholderiales bacterium]